MTKNMREGIFDLDYSDKIAGATFTVFTALRKEKIVDVGRRGKMHLDDLIKIGAKNIEVKTVVEAVKQRLKNTPINFTVATPIMNLMTSFKLSWNEVRMSCSKFQKRMVDGKPTAVDISAYQLSNVHIPFLRGITFKPERRSGMVKNMGSLALAINLANENRMTNKIEEAFRNSISHIDGNEIICKLLKDAKSPADVGQLLKLLGDYLLITGDRS